MFSAYCIECDHHLLISCRQLRRLANLAPGVIALEFECPSRQQLLVLTTRPTK